MTAKITNNFGTSAISRDISNTLPKLKDCGHIKSVMYIYFESNLWTLEIRIHMIITKNYNTDSVQLVLY